MPAKKEKDRENQPAKSSFWWKLAVFLLFFSVTFAMLDRIKDRWFVFQPNRLQEIAKSVITKEHNTTKDMMKALVNKLNEAYPGHINVKETWVWNNAGNAMGNMWLVHCSITEYLIIFGTAVGTEGHTGRHLADDYFIILTGEQWAFSGEEVDRHVFKPGDMHWLPRGEMQQYKMPDKCYALEYARGWIPAMLPFGVIECFTSTLDFVTVGRTFFEYGKLVIGELAQGKI